MGEKRVIDRIVDVDAQFGKEKFKGCEIVYPAQSMIEVSRKRKKRPMGTLNMLIPDDWARDLLDTGLGVKEDPPKHGYVLVRYPFSTQKRTKKKVAKKTTKKKKIGSKK